MSVVSERVNPQLGSVPETMLIPLWARALEQTHPEPLIVDPCAARIVGALDYNFDQFRSKRVEQENFCIRARVIDDLVSKILSESPPRTVVEFGPGLDTRYQRIGHLAKRWIEVDLPDAMSLRKQFLPGDGIGSGSHRELISCSMLDRSWIEQCGDMGSEPPLFIAEGVFYFFSREQIHDFLKTLSTDYPGSGLVFDAVSSWYLKLSNLRHPLSSSRLEFALSSGASEIPVWDSEFSVRDYVGFGDSPAYDRIIHRLPLWKRLALQLAPVVRHAFMVVHTGLGIPQEKS